MMIDLTRAMQDKQRKNKNVLFQKFNQQKAVINKQIKVRTPKKGIVNINRRWK